MNTMEWHDAGLLLLDQTLLPIEVKYINCSTVEDVVEAIKTMKVRGAPAIGVAAAYGLALGALHSESIDRMSFDNEIEVAGRMLGATRPTAVNLFWALNRMLDVLHSNCDKGVPEMKRILLDEAHRILLEDIEMNQRIGSFGSQLVPPGARVLTHCNAGALATGGYGTALGVIRAAHESGKQIQVFADETRPLLQGARLTAWELQQDNIPVTLITDSMAGYLMRKGIIDLAVVGADRIAANGDVANKIGTYTVAVLCREHGIPFYVAAPISTIDMNLDNGDDIVIEERETVEVTAVFGQQIAPQGIKVFNPAFDITPHRLITAIITDRGILRPPYKESLKNIFV
ncbi:S-methyl-5-thioribose-1-phosphate isomerase [Phosphitispora sp. TUW77]|uniref:S-methyl-5-thioribose-1-phosphate isomerase n=1 Tax=Phosphitispora sp. TUW77 TaxID=3152361 RepID=UPI003AB76087